VDVHVVVVMPNHIHGIFEINRGRIGIGIGTGSVCDLSVQENPPIPKIKSLSQLMGAYKTTVSKQIHLEGFAEFQWQRSFHDHIIRDEASYQTIFKYIENNPAKWGDDKFFLL